MPWLPSGIGFHWMTVVPSPQELRVIDVAVPRMNEVVAEIR